MKLRLVILAVLLALIAQPAFPLSVGAPRRVAPTSLLLAAVVQPAGPQQAQKPLTKDQVRVNPKDGLRCVWIPPGTFMMGCSPGDSECYGDEKPAHQITIMRGFWIGQTPVTVGAYKRFAGATGGKCPMLPASTMAG